MKPIPLNSTVPHEAKPRLGKQHLKIIELLRARPHTNTELLDVGMRFGARIEELRKAGYTINTVPYDLARGIYLYDLEREPPQ